MIKHATNICNANKAFSITENECRGKIFAPLHLVLTYVLSNIDNTCV